MNTQDPSTHGEPPRDEEAAPVVSSHGRRTHQKGHTMLEGLVIMLPLFLVLAVLSALLFISEAQP